MESFIDISSALDIPSHLTQEKYWHGHIPFAFWIISLLQPRTFVELGTYKGDSYCAFCQAVNKLSLNIRCYAVDNWKGDVHYGEYGEEIYHNLKSYHDPLYSHFSRLIRADFDEALSIFPNESIDLLHIDGTHIYESVRHDFENWQKKLSNRSIVLFHDIAEIRENYGVWRYWEELCTQYPHLTFSHSSGLGVLFTGKNVPSRLLELSNSTAEKKLFIKLFQRLGENLMIRTEINNQRLWFSIEAKHYQAELEKRNQELYALSQENANLNQVVMQLTNDIQNQLEKAIEYSQSIDRQNSHQQSLEQELTAYKNKVFNLQNKVNALIACVNKDQESLVELDKE